MRKGKYFTTASSATQAERLETRIVLVFSQLYILYYCLDTWKTKVSSDSDLNPNKRDMRIKQS